MYGDQRQSFILRNEIDDSYDKYDTVSYLEPSRSRPLFGPRSLDVTSEPVAHTKKPPSSTQEENSSTTSVPSTSERPTQEPNAGSSEGYETTPTEDMQELSGSNKTILYNESYPSSTNSTTTGTSIPETTPSSSTTSKSGESEERSPTSVPKKGVNACPVKEEVVAPFWANNTRVCYSTFIFVMMIIY
jgi:predicted membrane-bound mannosyltransferase